MRDTTGAAIPYAVVSVFPELSEGATTGQAVGTAVTDDDGFWSISLPGSGRYLIRCEHMAFETCDFFVVVGEETVRLETVLTPSAEYIEASKCSAFPSGIRPAGTKSLWRGASWPATAMRTNCSDCCPALRRTTAEAAR